MGVGGYFEYYIEGCAGKKAGGCNLRITYRLAEEKGKKRGEGVL